MKYKTIFLALSLAACGGGGSDTPNDCVIGLYGDSVSNGYLAPGVRMSPTPAEYLSQLTGVPVVDHSYNGASVLDFKSSGESVILLRFGVADGVTHVPLSEYNAAYSKVRGAIIVAPTYTRGGYELPYIYRDDVPYRLKPSLVDEIHPTEEYSRAVTEVIAEYIKQLCK